jgi:hypothetical protein
MLLLRTFNQDPSIRIVAMPARSRRADRKLAETAPILVAGDRRARIVLVSLLTLSGEPLESAIRVTVAALAPGETAVFVTDDPDFTPLARHGHLYEYFPSPASRKDYPSSEWESYFARRVRLLLKKWAPRRIVAAGQPIEAYLLEQSRDQ